ncbi:MAG: tRNA pseudouridine(54/55) synthase Pus10, partial [Thermoplasmata archaeon]
MKFFVDEINQICDHCLGRIFANMGHGLTNIERGRSIRILYAMENGLNINDIYPKRCSVCDDIFKKIEKFSEIALLSLKDYEFNTFLIGTKNNQEIVE